MPASKSSDKNSDAKTRKIIDVSEPGKTAPPETSRPIIVSSRPILRRDPMVTSPDGMEKEDTPEAKPVARTAKPMLKISPLAPDETSTEQSPPVAADTPSAPVPDTKPASLPVQPLAAAKASVPSAVTESDIIEDEEVPEVPAAETAEPEFTLEKPDAPIAAVPEVQPAVAAEPKPVVPAPTPTPASTPAVSAPAPTPAESGIADDEDDTDGQLAPNQAIDAAKRKEEDAKATRLAEQEKIIESKQYFLPINAVEKRRGLERFVLLLVLVILLALVWLDIALDAGIIRLGGVHALTHFFKS